MWASASRKGWAISGIGLIVFVLGCDMDGSQSASDDQIGINNINSDCDKYPQGPYRWWKENTVSRVSFPAVYGDGGKETELDMLDAYCNRNNVKSLVFAVGTKDCSECPSRFKQLAELESDIRAANGELVGVYWKNLQGDGLSVKEVSEILSGYGWESGWRITDSSDQVLWSAEDGSGNWLFSGVPNVWIIDTATMTIVQSEEVDYGFDIVDKVEAINGSR